MPQFSSTSTRQRRRFLAGSRRHLLGTALGAAQLNATASVPGTFVYTPAAGRMLPQGVHALSAIFTPADSAKFTEAKLRFRLLSQGDANNRWPAPASIAYGAVLGVNQLNATASVPGTFRLHS